MKKVYNIYGLDCVNCAHEVEEFLLEDESIASASVDFINKKLYVDYVENCYDVKVLESKINQVEKVSLSENNDKKILIEIEQNL